MSARQPLVPECGIEDYQRILPDHKEIISPSSVSLDLPLEARRLPEETRLGYSMKQRVR